MWVSRKNSSCDQGGREEALEGPRNPLGLWRAEFRTTRNEETGPEEPRLLGISAKVCSQEELLGSR